MSVFCAEFSARKGLKPLILFKSLNICLCIRYLLANLAGITCAYGRRRKR